MPADARNVGGATLRTRGVVGADGVPGVAEALDVAGQNPCPDVDVGARLEELALGDPERGQPGQPTRVDLHEPEVAAAVPVTADGGRVERGFGTGDGVEQIAAQAVAGGGLRPAGLRWDAQGGDAREAGGQKLLESDAGRGAEKARQKVVEIPTHFDANSLGPSGTIGCHQEYDYLRGSTLRRASQRLLTLAKRCGECES